MHYQLSDTEFNALESSANQLDFVADLCCHIEGQKSIPVDGLQSFLCALLGTLRATLKTAEERHEAQAVLDREQGAMQHFDWLYALRIARGDTLHTPNGSEQRITAKLAKAAQIDESMQPVLNEWLVALGAVPTPAAAATKAPKAPAKARKRDRLTAGAV